jgi:hypothetical protein
MQALTNSIATPAPSTTTKGQLIEAAKDVAEAAVAPPAIALRDVGKVHGQRDAAVVALDGINIDLPRGSFTAIMGRRCRARARSLTSRRDLTGPPPAPSRSGTPIWRSSANGAGPSWGASGSGSSFRPSI